MVGKTYKITDLDRKRAQEFVGEAKQFSKAVESIGGFGRRFMVCRPTPNQIHMYEGIETLALALGIDTLVVERDEICAKPIRKQFIYDGIVFFQLCSDEEKYRGTYKKFNTIKLKIKHSKKECQ